ncbi:acyl carrier protein [Acetoanaerobium pronyense]|uniref:Acyl carrier protein n=1 Tax=Acetoanaerobium pronyense TaxID=1482736 RepID=A0ABS4KG30_9FIRM|nr:acyl carrier protein [Acetoanaerobium pronyense]MBP2026724.1 acyl carrier protein [Acetoanaerobium pronyense]
MVYEKVRFIIADHLGLDEEKISLDTTITEDLEADSLDAVEIIMAIEDEFSIEIPDEQVENFVSLRDIVEYVETQL